MIQFEHVNKAYNNTPILKDLTFTINDGEFVVLVGPSGCGKTTTLKTINRLVEPDSGRILIDGEDTQTVNKVDLRRHIGYVIQQIGLFPNMTVAQNITVVPKMLKYTKEQCDEIVRKMLKLVNMEEHIGKYPSELSGGQQQRIGVLRALAASPSIVLMDEPFSALDPQTRKILQNEIKRIQQELHKTIVFVTHDMDEALKLADTIIFMDKGQIVQMDTPEGILENPATERVSVFLGRYDERNSSRGTIENFMRTNIETIEKDRGIIECTERMAGAGIDSLIITDMDGKYMGVVTIGDIHKYGLSLKTIEPLIHPASMVAHVGDVAKESIDYLLDEGSGYVVVLNEDETVAGIVTKSSITRSVANRLWGDEQ